MIPQQLQYPEKYLQQMKNLHHSKEFFVDGRIFRADLFGVLSTPEGGATSLHCGIFEEPQPAQMLHTLKEKLSRIG
jgi:hypothetical protein